MSLPITTKQQRSLRLLQVSHPELGFLAVDIAQEFDASAIDNPELARVILEKTCRRIIAGEAGALEVMIQHIKHFGALNCLSSKQVAGYVQQLRNMQEPLSLVGSEHELANPAKVSSSNRRS